MAILLHTKSYFIEVSMKGGGAIIPNNLFTWVMDGPYPKQDLSKRLQTTMSQILIKCPRFET